MNFSWTRWSNVQAMYTKVKSPFRGDCSVHLLRLDNFFTRLLITATCVLVRAHRLVWPRAFPR